MGREGGCANSPTVLLPRPTPHEDFFFSRLWFRYTLHSGSHVPARPPAPPPPPRPLPLPTPQHAPRPPIHPPTHLQSLQKHTWNKPPPRVSLSPLSSPPTLRLVSAGLPFLLLPASREKRRESPTLKRNGFSPQRTACRVSEVRRSVGGPNTQTVSSGRRGLVARRSSPLPTPIVPSIAEGVGVTADLLLGGGGGGVGV